MTEVTEEKRPAAAAKEVGREGEDGKKAGKMLRMPALEFEINGETMVKLAAPSGWAGA